MFPFLHPRVLSALGDLTHSIQGGDKYQQAFYVFEELAQAPATSSVASLVSQAVCEIHLGRLEEAQAALEQALQKEPGAAEAIANMIVLSTLNGEDASELTRYGYASCLFSQSCPPPSSSRSDILTLHGRSLQKANPNHQLLLDMEEKSALFDKAASKYRAKVAS